MLKKNDRVILIADAFNVGSANPLNRLLSPRYGCVGTIVEIYTGRVFPIAVCWDNNSISNYYCERHLKPYGGESFLSENNPNKTFTDFEKGK